MATGFGKFRVPAMWSAGRWAACAFFASGMESAFGSAITAGAAGLGGQRELWPSKRLGGAGEKLEGRCPLPMIMGKGPSSATN